LLVAVSDSGLGIMQTLRPALSAEFSNLVGLSDTDLLVEVFREGLSRHGRLRTHGESDRAHQDERSIVRLTLIALIDLELLLAWT
jgi:hypothetical protein